MATESPSRKIAQGPRAKNHGAAAIGREMPPATKQIANKRTYPECIKQTSSGY
jgi:hypothetical protein